jgi:hypothetical protein
MLKPSTAWRAIFQALRQDYQRAADTTPALRHFIAEGLDGATGLPSHLQQALDGLGMGWSVSIQLMTAPWDNRRQMGYLYGPDGEVKAFQRLAERAWLALPGTTAGKAQAYPQMQPTERWLAFVYNTLREHPGSYLSADDVLWVRFGSAEGPPQEVGFIPHWVTRDTLHGRIHELGYPEAETITGPVQRWKLSALATDPFTASTVAIDMLLADPDPEGPFLISAEEMDVFQ